MAAIREFLGTTQQPLDGSHEDILTELSDAGILVQRGSGQDEPYHFPHPLIQTYLAICALAQSQAWRESAQWAAVALEGATLTLPPPPPDEAGLEGIVIDATRTWDLVATAQRPGMRARVLDGLVPLVGTGLQRRRDPTERYWIYIALGAIGVQAASPMDRGKAQSAVQQGLLEDDAFARWGAVEAWKAFGHDFESVEP
jgi:hypothetical protein